MNKEELQKMADEHFAANPKETKCYATSDGNVWMDKDKAFAQRHADSLKETAIEFIRKEKALAPEPEVKKEAPKKAKAASEPKAEELEKEEPKKDLKKAEAPKVETPKAAPKKAAPVKTAKKK